MTITGATRIFPIIGHPVAGVFSPPAYNSYFENKGLDVRMIGLDIPPQALDAFWQLLRASPGIIGCSVTYPHKQAAFAEVDGMTPRAARLGALNTIRCTGDGRLMGEATDGLALSAAISEAGVDLAGRTAHIIGAGGGAGMAITDALCEQGIGGLILSERAPDRRAALNTLLDKHWRSVPIADPDAEADILINATTLGKADSDPLPFPSEVIRRAGLVCDAVTAPDDTALIAMARAAVATVVTGNDMGAGQLAAQLGFLGL